MTDTKKAEELSENDLSEVQGGLGNFEIQMRKTPGKAAKPGTKGVITSAGGGSGSI